jgi:hypothetical protein
MVEVLLKGNVDVNQRDCEGKTALRLECDETYADDRLAILKPHSAGRRAGGEVVNSAGEVVHRTVLSISPGRRETKLIPSNLSSGYVRITSNLPVYATGNIGTTDLKLLDPLPAIPR